ncbi:hypothetical protein NA57DRAFT_75299 [Rhizodiscina lignyota]|uniref:Yeast cell wall synthesis Kre9/Knh1-like N-terminal domain-containing protein n=1 Tax=Rhizodiscina lignyota TaxID=1504668 RepID=A0A9P4IF52_9PEZI|nr:hypothetical protein NA57DRAFT_75299 [Rhizodiscina lignyota]
MHFFKSLIVCASALATLVAADIQFTSAPNGAEAGHTYDLAWSGADSSSPVTILLRKGPSNDLTTVSTITTAATGGKYQWTVPANLPADGDYALQISQGSQTNYWSVGAIAGGVASASASASASSAASSASASASSTASSASASLSSAESSLSSKISSEIASKTISSVSAGTTGLSSSSRNGTTISRATLTRTSTHSASASGSPSSTESSSETAASTSAEAAPTTGAASHVGLKSNAALVLGAVAAMVYLG